MAGFPAPVLRGAAQGRATAAVIFLCAVNPPPTPAAPPIAPTLMLCTVIWRRALWQSRDLDPLTPN